MASFLGPGFGAHQENRGPLFYGLLRIKRVVFFKIKIDNAGKMQAHETPLQAGAWHSDHVVHTPKEEERKGWGGRE